MPQFVDTPTSRRDRRAKQREARKVMSQALNSEYVEYLEMTIRAMTRVRRRVIGVAFVLVAGLLATNAVTLTALLRAA